VESYEARGSCDEDIAHTAFSIIAAPCLRPAPVAQPHSDVHAPHVNLIIGEG
jgi:hypothetical protein